MSQDRILAILKPDVVSRSKSGAILEAIEAAGFEIVALKQTQLTKKQAEQFYQEHKNKPFFEKLIRFMTGSPIVAAVLQKENAIADWRTKMEVLREVYGTDETKNACHGSDSKEAAKREIAFFFTGAELKELSK